MRAEILGAFFNAVFLIALCVSIILEALTRFVKPPEIDNPRLILIVGCAGLFSNLLGFFVLGGHGHSHDHDHDHDAQHGHEDSHHDFYQHDVEEGGSAALLNARIADDDGAVNDVLPEVVFRRATNAADRSGTDGAEATRRLRFGTETQNQDESNAPRGNRTPGHPRGRRPRRSSKSGHSRFASIDDMSIHPASFRQDIIAASLAASSAPAGQTAESETSEDSPLADSESEVNAKSPLLGASRNNNANRGNKSLASRSASASRKRRSRRDSSVHDGHNHTLPRKAGSKASGHNHADMGMNAMMLHVLGDALGNVGVIITALVIWLTDWPGKVYADPTVSLLITAIILKTSVPLTLATARVQIGRAHV